MPANKSRRRLIGPMQLLQASAFALSLGLLAACETMPKAIAELPLIGKGASMPSPVGPLAPPAARTWPNEATDVLNQRARGFGLVNAPDMQRYLNQLYARIKTQAGVPAWPGAVHILANDALNAYATGAGNIYISMPWLSSVESEDELVALLSHEFGHVYLHYHQLEGAVDDANTTAGVVSVGFAIVKKTGQATGWTQLGRLTTAYMLGRGLATTIYSRSQESAADNFGLNLSLKLGYSYEHGMKAFLERMATWEDKNAVREKEQQEQMIKAVRQQALDNAMKGGGRPPDNALTLSIAQGTGEISGGINSAMKQLGFELNKAAAKLRSDHPETTERIDALALAVEPFPDIQSGKDAVTAPLKRALQERRTAGIFKNYALAFKAINAPKDAASVEAARNAVTAPTATHAVPLFALYTVLNEQPAAAGKKMQDPGQLLEANFNAEPDRAWKTYQERSAKLKDARQAATAKKVLDAGLAYFQNAEEVWPDAIRFYGEAQGWDEAKRMAANCGKNFRRVSERCAQAASSPAELAEVERKSKVKAEQIVDNMLKKK
jgi:Zn-dependent protease with chaperone function